MNKQFLKECLKQWQQAREYTSERIKRYEEGDRSALLSLMYERGDFHKTLKDIDEKINTINKQLATA